MDGSVRKGRSDKGVPRGPRGMNKVQNRVSQFPRMGQVTDVHQQEVVFPSVMNSMAVSETDEQISARISNRFDILVELTQAAIVGDARALIVSGPAGLGKSYTVERELSDWDVNGDNHTIVKGYVKVTGLYKLLYAHRQEGKVLVFDDADSIFFDDVALNLLKTVCDTNEVRTVSYLSEGSLIDESSGERVPRSFEFNGTIIFITNYDFDAMIEKKHRLAPHLQAMISRAHYIDLAMKTNREYLIRIKQIFDGGLLDDKGLTDEMKADVMDFITKNSSRLRELSLRIALKISTIRRSNPLRWKETANITCCKN
jgi:hypothetical protein